MAKSIKESGVDELNAFRRRVQRQAALGRISSGDRDKICMDVDQLISFCVQDLQEQDGEIEKRFI